MQDLGGKGNFPAGRLVAVYWALAQQGLVTTGEICYDGKKH